MMKNSTAFWSLRRRPRGLTLIEVVAGLALMATILVALLIMKTRFTHQLADSNLKLRGVAAADSLLTAWWAEPNSFPIDRSGKISEFPGLNWHTRIVTNEVVSHLDAKVVRLDITADAQVVISIEVMLPLESHPAN